MKFSIKGFFSKCDEIRSSTSIALENIRKYPVFMGYRSGTLVENGLIKNLISQSYDPTNHVILLDHQNSLVFFGHRVSKKTYGNFIFLSCLQQSFNFYGFSFALSIL